MLLHCLLRDEIEWSTSRPVRFTPAKYPQYPLNERLCGPQGCAGSFEKRKTARACQNSNTVSYNP